MDKIKPKKVHIHPRRKATKHQDVPETTMKKYVKDKDHKTPKNKRPHCSVVLVERH